MDYTALKTYIDSDSVFAPWIEGGNDQQIADEINSRSVFKVGSVSRSRFAMWCGATGLRAVIQDHAENSQSPLRAVCLTLLDFLQGGVSDELHLDDPMNQVMLGAWVQAGALTQDQVDALTVLATTAEPVFGRAVNNLDVAKAYGRMGV